MLVEFVEPFAGDRERRFHVDVERRRRLTGLDVFHRTGGVGRVVHEAVRVTVGDGSLDLDLHGPAGAVLSLVAVQRV